MLASEIEPRTYAVSLKAAESKTETEAETNKESSLLEQGIFALVTLTVSVYLIMHFYRKRAERHIETDDCFQRGVDEEVPADRPSSA